MADTKHANILVRKPDEEKPLGRSMHITGSYQGGS